MLLYHQLIFRNARSTLVEIKDLIPFLKTFSKTVRSLIWIWMETILKKNLLNNLTMSFNKIKAFRTLSFHLFWKKVSSNRSKSSWMLNQAYLKIWEQEELWILGAKSIGLSQKKEVRKITLIIVLTVYQDHLRKKILEYKKKMIVNPLFKMAIVIVNHLKKLNTLI